MELTADKSGCWLPDLQKTATTALALFTLPLFRSITPANEPEELSAHETDGVYSAWVISVIDAPMDHVYNVITGGRSFSGTTPVPATGPCRSGGSAEVRTRVTASTRRYGTGKEAVAAPGT